VHHFNTSRELTRLVVPKVSVRAVIRCMSGTSDGSSNPPVPTPVVPERTATVKGFTFSDGSVYVGEVVNNMRHGKGKMVWAASGLNYEGDWENDKPHGTGEIDDPGAHKSFYRGEMRFGKKHGQGEYWDNECHYTGGWAEGMYDGFGAVTMTKSNAKYEGESKAFKMHGEGKYTYENGDVYEGAFENDQKHGHGRFTTHNGAVYEGDYQYDKQRGKGRVTFPGGS